MEREPENKHGDASKRITSSAPAVVSTGADCSETWKEMMRGAGPALIRACVEYLNRRDAMHGNLAMQPQDVLDTPDEFLTDASSSATFPPNRQVGE